MNGGEGGIRRCYLSCLISEKDPLQFSIFLSDKWIEGRREKKLEIFMRVRDTPVRILNQLLKKHYKIKNYSMGSYKL